MCVTKSFLSVFLYCLLIFYLKFFGGTERSPELNPVYWLVTIVEDVFIQWRLVRLLSVSLI